MARTPDDPKLDELIADLAPELRPIAECLRAVIRAVAPELRESVKWGSPVWIGLGNTLCLMVYPRHINLGFFRGAELVATFPEITGTGKSLRHVLVPDVRYAGSPAVRKMVRAAARLDAAVGSEASPAGGPAGSPRRALRPRGRSSASPSPGR